MTNPASRPAPDAESSASNLDWAATLPLHQPWLRRVIASRLGEPQAIDEVMQDVALAAISQRSPLLNPTRISVWLYRLAVRHVLIYRRKSGRRRSLLDRYASRQSSPQSSASPSPLVWLVMDEREKLVQQALEQLPSRDAQLLLMKHTEGSTARELADRLGVTVTTIEARLHRARHKLRAELAKLTLDFEADDHAKP